MARTSALGAIIFLSVFFMGGLPAGFAGASPAPSKPAPPPDHKAYFLCKQKKNARTIRVQVNEEDNCLTYYSKDGSQKVVGHGKHHDVCMTWLNNIKTNL